MFSGIGLFRRISSSSNHSQTSEGDDVVTIPAHLSKAKEEDDFLVVGDTASERSEVRPGQNWPTQTELPLTTADCRQQPPSYEAAEARERELSRSHQHPAADIPFTLHPHLRLVMDATASPIPKVQPPDFDKFLYDFTLEEEVKGNERWYGERSYDGRCAAETYLDHTVYPKR